jgi:hypothetical protein
MSAMRISTVICLALAAIIIFSGCISTYAQNREIDSMQKKLAVPENTFLAITNGSSLDAVRSTLGIAARLEFTVSEKKINYTLIDCSVSHNANLDDENDFWLLFQDKTLVKKLVPKRPKPEDIEELPKLVMETINAPARTESQMLDYLKPYNGKGMQHTSIAENVFWAGAFAGVTVLTAGYPLWTWHQGNKELKNEYSTNEMFLKLYDGCRASLGRSVEEVDALYGKPLQVLSMKNGQTARIYGDNRNLENIKPWLLFSCVAVVFDTHGNVAAIYSDDFFSDDWKK